jgi:branched-subunit amino acid permease
MAPETFIEKQEENITPHIFSVSAAMVGVCLTVIGIINIITKGQTSQTIADDVVVLNAIFFLITCLLSYSSIRTKNRKHRLKLELLTDSFFLISLILMVGVCLILVYFFHFIPSH